MDWIPEFTPSTFGPYPEVNIKGNSGKGLLVHAVWAYCAVQAEKAGQITSSEVHFPDLIRVKDRLIVRLGGMSNDKVWAYSHYSWVIWCVCVCIRLVLPFCTLVVLLRPWVRLISAVIWCRTDALNKEEEETTADPRCICGGGENCTAWADASWWHSLSSTPLGD